jgi:hypothetical protein
MCVIGAYLGGLSPRHILGPASIPVIPRFSRSVVLVRVLTANSYDRQLMAMNKLNQNTTPITAKMITAKAAFNKALQNIVFLPNSQMATRARLPVPRDL